ncbi:MAG: hypothetical protein DSY76_09560 [Bacteroidetes bacterium]|nr:MAG: hypothetical protein DSY76_09560 [Bacteroidota bacterium]
MSFFNNKESKHRNISINENEQNTLKKLIYKKASFIALIASLIGLAVNIGLYLSQFFSLSIAFIAIAYAIFYYFAQFKNRYFTNAFVLVSQVGLMLTWYSEGGLSGPVLPLFVIAIIVFSAVADQKFHMLYLGISVLNIIALFLLEQSKVSDYVIQYPSKFYHDLDIAITLIVSVVSIFYLSRYIKNVFIKKHNVTVQQRNELEQLNRTKDKFFSIIAHDLRGPFNGLIELTKLMADKSVGLSKNDLQDLSSKLNESAKNTFNLLENLLDWAKMNQGMIAYKPQKIRLREFISLHLNAIQDLADRKKIITANNIPTSTEVFADSYMLQAIIRNITINSIKFTPKGGFVEINAKTINQSIVEVTINDNGIGMDQKTIESIFTIENQHKRMGTDNEPSSGLGLILCKEFVERHQGKINVESEVGVGSTFRFTIPANASTHES